MQKYVINTAHVSSEIFDGEAVVVNFMTGKYFGMRGSAPEIWKLFDSPVSRDDIISIVAGINGITDIMKEQVQSFISILLQEELIIDAESCPDSPAVKVKAQTLNQENFLEPPVIEIFDDLQELIVLDPIHDADPERGWPAQQRMIKP